MSKTGKRMQKKTRENVKKSAQREKHTQKDGKKNQKNQHDINISVWT